MRGRGEILHCAGRCSKGGAMGQRVKSAGRQRGVRRPGVGRPVCLCGGRYRQGRMIGAAAVRTRERAGERADCRCLPCERAANAGGAAQQQYDETGPNPPCEAWTRALDPDTPAAAWRAEVGGGPGGSIRRRRLGIVPNGTRRWSGVQRAGVRGHVHNRRGGQPTYLSIVTQATEPR